MRDGLLRAFVRVTLTWFILLFLWWGFSDARIADSVRRLTGHAVTVTPLNALAWLWFVVVHYMFPVLGVVAALFFLGHFLAHGLHWKRRRDVEGRVIPDTSWRGMEVSMGMLPHPDWETAGPVAPVDFGPWKNRVAELPAPHQRVLRETLSAIAAHPDAYVGPGHTDSLLEHTLGVLESTWDSNPRCDALLPLLSAAHDMGKIRAWVRNDKGEWRRNGWHDEWSARLFSGLPGFWELPPDERKIALIALRYSHKFSRAPLLNELETQRLVRLHELLEGADRKTTAEEKKAVVEAHAESLPELLTAAFLDALSETLIYQSAQTPKGAKAGVWRKNARLYISEPLLRDALLHHLPENIAAAIESSRKAGKLSPLTAALVDALRVQGWLVEALPEPGTRTEEGKPIPLMIASPPLWNVRSGNINLNGVLIVNIPVEEQYRLKGNAPFPMMALCPTYDSQGRRIDTKSIVIPREFLEAAELENGRALKAEEDEADGSGRCKNPTVVSPPDGAPLFAEAPSPNAAAREVSPGNGDAPAGAGHVRERGTGGGVPRIADAPPRSSAPPPSGDEAAADKAAQSARLIAASLGIGPSGASSGPKGGQSGKPRRPNP